MSREHNSGSLTDNLFEKPPVDILLLIFEDFVSDGIDLPWPQAHYEPGRARTVCTRRRLQCVAPTHPQHRVALVVPRFPGVPSVTRRA